VVHSVDLHRHSTWPRTDRPLSGHRKASLVQQGPVSPRSALGQALRYAGTVGDAGVDETLRQLGQGLVRSLAQNLRPDGLGERHAISDGGRPLTGKEIRGVHGMPTAGQLVGDPAHPVREPLNVVEQDNLGHLAILVLQVRAVNKFGWTIVDQSRPTTGIGPFLPRFRHSMHVSIRAMVPLFLAFESSKVDRLSPLAARDKAASTQPVPCWPRDHKVATGLAIASVLGCVATVLCYLLLVHTSAGQRLDNAAYYGAVHARSQHFGFMDGPLERIDERSLKLVMVAIFAIGLLRFRPILGIGGALVAGGPVATAHVLRFHVLDHSPFAVGSAIGSTFPSDHTAAAVGCAMAAVLVSPPWLRGLVAILAGAFAAAVAAQVQVVGWHRASDSVGAALLAFAFAAAVAGVLAWTRPGRARKHRRHWWAVAVMATAGTGAIVLGVLSAARGIATFGGVASPGGQHQAYLAGLGVTIGIVALLLAAFLLLLGDADFDDGWRRSMVAARDLLQGSTPEAPDPSDQATAP